VLDFLLLKSLRALDFELHSWRAPFLLLDATISVFQCNIVARFSRGSDRNKLLLQDILSQISDGAAPALASSQSQGQTIKLLIHLDSKRLRDKRYLQDDDDNN
jgi:hypothetical protein